MKYRISAILDASLMGTVVELLAPYGQVNVKLVEEGERPIRATVEPSFSLAKRRVQAIKFSPERGQGTIVVLRAVAKNMTVQQIKAELAARGLAGNGSGATLSKLKRRGYIRHLDKGVWGLSPKGEIAVRRLDTLPTTAHEVVEAEHEGSDS